MEGGHQQPYGPQPNPPFQQPYPYHGPQPNPPAQPPYPYQPELQQYPPNSPAQQPYPPQQPLQPPGQYQQQPGQYQSQPNQQQPTESKNKYQQLCHYLMICFLCFTCPISLPMMALCYCCENWLDPEMWLGEQYPGLPVAEEGTQTYSELMASE